MTGPIFPVQLSSIVVVVVPFNFLCTVTIADFLFAEHFAVRGMDLNSVPTSGSQHPPPPPRGFPAQPAVGLFPAPGPPIKCPEKIPAFSPTEVIMKTLKDGTHQQMNFVISRVLFGHRNVQMTLCADFFYETYLPIVHLFSCQPIFRSWPCLLWFLPSSSQKILIISTFILLLT